MTRLLPGARRHAAGLPGPAPPDDAREIELSLREPDRFGAIFDRYFTEIHRYLARRIGPDAADDLAAETFLTAFRARHRFDSGRGTVRAWLFGIATHQVSRHRRAELRGLRAIARAAQPTIVDSHADRVAERVTAGAARRQLAAALAELPGRDREAQLRALPADPARLRSLLLSGGGDGDGTVSYLFQVTPAVLAMPVTPAVRAALYQMLAGLPGVRSLGPVRDVGGRPGVAVAISGRYSHCGDEDLIPDSGTGIPWTFASCVVQQILVISPRTGLPLAEELRYLRLPSGQSWPVPGRLFSFELFGTAHWTDASPPAS